MPEGYPSAAKGAPIEAEAADAGPPGTAEWGILSEAPRLSGRGAPMIPLVERNLDAIRALGRRYGVARLEVFGSANTAAFDPERSDVDFLVSYPPGYDYGAWMGRVQDLEAELATLLGRKVDLVLNSALENRWFRREAAKTREVVYDAAEDAEVA
jgi:uncharacterized protein